MIDPKNIYIDTTNQASLTMYDPDTCVAGLIKLFVHELQRVFGDRLTNRGDVKWLV